MIRAAVPILLAFVALLVFVYAITSRRRKRIAKDAEDLLLQLGEQDELLASIQQIARDAADVDPSAALIDQIIKDFHRKGVTGN